MRKFFLILALGIFSAVSFAATIGAPASIDFGSYSIKGLTEVTDSVELTLNPSGISEWGIGVEVVNDAQGIFWVSDSWLYANGTPDYNGEKKAKVYFYAQEAGTYTATLRLTDYNDEQEDVALQVVVTSDAVVAKTMPFERIETTSGLHAGDTIVFVCESAGAVGGPLNSTYLPEVTENVSIDAAQGTAQVPETAQMFVLSQYSGNWQLTAVGTSNRLLLDISDKGAFAYGTPSSTLLAGWGISISNGVAEMYRPSDESFPVWFNGDRFKPYKNPGNYTEIALYKKAGAAVEVQSKLEVESIDMGEVEMQDTAVVVVNYTAEHLESDILWDVTGADAGLFKITDNGNRTSGTLTIEYKRNATKTGAVNAKVYALYTNAQVDDAEAYFDIHLTLKANTILLTGLSFDGAPTTIDQHQTIDMSQYLVFTPNDAEDKSVTWATDHDYQGTIDADGKLYAKQVTGTVTVTATSVRVPSVSASHTLTITVPTITDFTLSDSEITLLVGGKDTLSATAFVPDYASATPTFASSDATVAAVSNKGIITAKALGDAVITATIGEVNKTCTVHVVATAVDTIYFDAEEARLNLGSTLQLAPVVEPAQAAADHTVAYASGNEAVATVSETGLVTSVAEGDAVITATADGKSAQITIHVVAPMWFEKVTDATALAEKDTIILATIYESKGIVAGERNEKKLTVLKENLSVTATQAYADDAIRLVLGTLKNKEGFTLQPVGSQLILAEQNNDLYAETVNSTKNLTWQFVQDGENGVYVQNVGNENAMFKYLAANNAIKPYKTNTAGAVYVYAYVRKYIAPEAESVSLNKDSLRMHVGDQNVKLKATVAPAEAEQAVAWSSTDETVATVDASGWVHAVAEGEAKIVVKVQSNELLTDTCVVLISEWRVESIELDVAEDTLTVGETLRINATVEPTGHHFDVDFYSSDTTVATVTIGGLVTAVAPGDAIITAKSGDVEATVKIHVEAVKPIVVESVELADTAAVLKIDSTLQLAPIVTPAEALAEYSLSYASSDTTVATVSESGLVTAVAEGTAVITVTISDKSTTITIYVEKEEDQAIEDVDARAKAYKVLRDGRIIIIRGEKVYSVDGRVERVNE